MENGILSSPYTFEYSDGDLFLDISGHSEPSKFDAFLRPTWQEAMDNGCFNYKLANIETKISEGQPEFIMQLNPNRGNKRRPGAPMTDMNMTFDPGAFHFNKIQAAEILCRIKPQHSSKDEDHMLIINVSPLEFGHVLLVPNTKASLPQRLDMTAARLGLDLMLLSTHRGFRVGFNSLLAMASVNHLHLHAWYLDHPLLLQSATVQQVRGRLFETTDYFAPAFVFQLHASDPQQMAQDVHRVASHLQTHGIAHNVFMTRGAVFGRECSCQHSTVRVYIWPRKSVSGAKETVSVPFNVAVAELAGHVPMYDEEAFRSYKSSDIYKKIRENLFSTEEFNRIKDCLQTQFLPHAS